MIYITKQNDRWDQISMKFYGHPDKYNEIIKANPDLNNEIKIAALLPSGVELEIPELEEVPVYPEELPPWKR